MLVLYNHERDICILKGNSDKLLHIFVCMAYHHTRKATVAGLKLNLKTKINVLECRHLKHFFKSILEHRKNTSRKFFEFCDLQLLELNSKFNTQAGYGLMVRLKENIFYGHLS